MPWTNSGAPINVAETLDAFTLPGNSGAHTTKLLNVGRYETLGVHIGVTGTSTPGLPVRVDISWQDDSGNVMDVDSFTFVTWTGESGGCSSILRTPVRTDFVQVTYTSGAGLGVAAFNTFVIASTQTIPFPMIRNTCGHDSITTQYSSPPLLLRQSGIIIAAGTSSNPIYLPPVTKTMRVVAQVNGAPAETVLIHVSTLVFDPLSLTIDPYPLGQVYCPTSQGGSFDFANANTIDVPFGIPFEAVVVNNDASDRTPTVLFYDSSEN